MMSRQQLSAAVALLCAMQVAALQCPHMITEYRNGKLFTDDLGVVTCEGNATNYCMYHASTTFYPNASSVPSHYEAVLCSDGSFFRAPNQTEGIDGEPMDIIDFCDATTLGQSYNFNVTVDGVVSEVVHRVNSVRCCKTDNCTLPEYSKIGGGSVQKSSTVSAYFNRVKTFFSNVKSKLHW